MYFSFLSNKHYYVNKLTNCVPSFELPNVALHSILHRAAGKIDHRKKKKNNYTLLLKTFMPVFPFIKINS